MLLADKQRDRQTNKQTEPNILPTPIELRSFCQTPHKLMNRVTANLTLTLTLTDTGGAVLTLMLG